MLPGRAFALAGGGRGAPLPPRGSGPLHEEVGEEDAPALHLLLPDHMVAPALEEGPGGEGGVDLDPPAGDKGLQPAAQGGADPLPWWPRWT